MTPPPPVPEIPLVWCAKWREQGQDTPWHAIRQTPAPPEPEYRTFCDLGVDPRQHPELEIVEVEHVPEGQECPACFGLQEAA